MKNMKQARIEICDPNRPGAFKRMLRKIILEKLNKG